MPSRVTVGLSLSIGLVPELSVLQPLFIAIQIANAVQRIIVFFIVEADVPRIKCAEHGVVQIRVPWTEDGSRYTVAFESLVIDWLRDASTSAVAKHLSLGWSAVNGIMQRAVDRGLARRMSTLPVHLSVDET